MVHELHFSQIHTNTHTRALVRAHTHTHATHTMKTLHGGCGQLHPNTHPLPPTPEEVVYGSMTRETAQMLVFP